MQLNISTDYAIRIVVYLATVGEATTGADISRAMAIPHNYLREIARKLLKAEILCSTQGGQGRLRLSPKTQRHLPAGHHRNNVGDHPHQPLHGSRPLLLPHGNGGLPGEKVLSARSNLPGQQLYSHHRGAAAYGRCGAIGRDHADLRPEARGRGRADRMRFPISKKEEVTGCAHTVDGNAEDGSASAVLDDRFLYRIFANVPVRLWGGAEKASIPLASDP